MVVVGDVHLVARRVVDDAHSLGELRELHDNALAGEDVYLRRLDHPAGVRLDDEVESVRRLVVAGEMPPPAAREHDRPRIDELPVAPVEQEDGRRIAVDADDPVKLGSGDDLADRRRGGRVEIDQFLPRREPRKHRELSRFRRIETELLALAPGEERVSRFLVDGDRFELRAGLNRFRSRAVARGDRETARSDEVDLAGLSPERQRLRLEMLQRPPLDGNVQDGMVPAVDERDGRAERVRDDEPVADRVHSHENGPRAVHREIRLFEKIDRRDRDLGGGRWSGRDKKYRGDGGDEHSLYHGTALLSSYPGTLPPVRGIPL